LSTLALDGSSGLESGGRGLLVLRYLDLPLLALALPVFLVFDFPMLGYAVAAAAWLVQRGIQVVATRRAGRDDARGERRRALGIMAGATLARVWLISLSVLLVGLAEREAGLAAAVLSAGLFTVYLSAQFLAHLFEPQESGP
jgi:hypothetical protein